MGVRNFFICLAALCVLTLGCTAETRYQVLSVFFDGVPAPKPPEPLEGTKVTSTSKDSRSRDVGYREHGPYGARLCTACHVPNSLSELVAPREQLCFQCHELTREKKYVHGPLASGGCLACHDPHSSQYRYFLLSASDDFCYRCHDQNAMGRVPAHADAGNECTKCHDPHMSDKRYLLR